MRKQLIERLRGFKDTPRTADNLCHEAADRIEELERANQHLIMALADAEALEIGTAERCDALQADNARLRDAFQTFIDEHEECQDADEWMAELCSIEALHVAGEALATTPEQSLAEYRNKVIENCAKQCEAPNEYVFHRTCYESAEAIRTIKDQP